MVSTYLTCMALHMGLRSEDARKNLYSILLEWLAKFRKDLQIVSSCLFIFKYWIAFWWQLWSYNCLEKNDKFNEPLAVHANLQFFSRQKPPKVRLHNYCGPTYKRRSVGVTTATFNVVNPAYRPNLIPRNSCVIKRTHWSSIVWLLILGLVHVLWLIKAFVFDLT